MLGTSGPIAANCGDVVSADTGKKEAAKGPSTPHRVLHDDGRLSGCVYTYPDIRISGYPDVKDPDFFGAFTRVELKRFRRLHVSRYPDALYAAYSLCVGEIRKCFSLVKLHAFKLSSIFSFLFVDVCWLDDKVKILFGKFSYRL